MSVLIQTSLGDIVVDLYTERCPRSSTNFVKLCKLKYYHGTRFHEVQRHFVARAGDPEGSGMGGESVWAVIEKDPALRRSKRYFEDEIHPKLKHKLGSLCFASAGPNLNASQFYIALRDGLDYLDGKHTVFGEVAEGFDVLEKIDRALVDEKHRPLRNIRIRHTYVLDDPFPDIPGLIEPAESPIPIRDAVDVDFVEDDDVLDADQDKDDAEVAERLRESEAKSRAVLLEMVGDLPDADVKPPDNVLFVCKLNPVTTSEDLEIIFSRFGSISGCEVIRDWKTGDSLQYAFIEFENDEQCALAFQKMENVLIDDRRIHVDFSQSVAEIWRSWRKGEKMSSSNTTARNQSTRGIHQRGSPKPSYSMVFDTGDRELHGTSPTRKSSIRPRYQRDRPRSRSISPHVSRRREHSRETDRSHRRREHSRETDRSHRRRH